jgi:hypothetical protein
MATDHKVRFFENGATPNLVVKGIPATKGQFEELVDRWRPAMPASRTPTRPCT